MHGTEAHADRVARLRAAVDAHKRNGSDPAVLQAAVAELQAAIAPVPHTAEETIDADAGDNGSD